jgi:glycosyltransferase involved in cell wall biosynthesis
MRILLVQYTGDFREAVNRLSQGGEETYYAQRYSVDTIARIGEKVEEMAALVCVTPDRYNEVLQNGIRGIGAGFGQDWKNKDLISLIEAQKPTHIILTFPSREVLRWAIQHRIPTIAVLADSFQTDGWRNKWRNYRLARLLNHERIEWVGNHNINAALSLQAIGVNPAKIVPWDWPPVVTPANFSPKQLRPSAQPWQLVYVGMITPAKGVGDLLEAIAALKARKIDVTLKVAGKGDVDAFQKQAKRLGIEDAVELLGMVSNQKVVHLMREADAVIVPSRHEYPEGLPMTIYEALCARTPIVASDHPMFQGKLTDGVSAIVFPAHQPLALADSLEKLLSDPELYHQLSKASEEAWQQLQIPVKFADFLNHWLFDPKTEQPWLGRYCLSSGQDSKSV